MKVDIDSETADNITIEVLKEQYDNVFQTLKNTLSENDLIATHSFDFDEEVFSIIKDLKAFELILKIFGYSIKLPIEDFLREKNEEIYITDKSLEELKKENETLKNKLNCIEEELSDLKAKITSLAGL
jgi:DNA-directed RNA polymerase subunit L